MQNLKIYFFFLYNIIKFRFRGVVFGQRLRILGLVDLKMIGDAKIIIGDNFHLTSGYMFNSIGRNIKSCLRADNGSILIIGNDVGMSNVSIWAKSKIEIGNNVKIGADTIIVDSDMHSLNFIERRNCLTDAINAKKKEVKIGNDVFIGTRSIICKGVTIDDRSIVGAGSVVVSNIPQDEIWGGNPAKFIKKIN